MDVNELRDRFSKSRIKKITKNLYDKNPKKSFNTKNKKMIMVITSNMKAMGTKTKIYHLKNILI